MNLVILHGWGHSGAMWQGFINKFHDHKVIFIGLPGFGEEKLISNNWNVADYADWVLLKLKSMGIKNTIIIGHSFGGKVATEIAIKDPSIVKKLVLVAAPVLRRPALTTKLHIKANKIIKNMFLSKAIKIQTNSEYKEANANNLGAVFVNSVNYDATSKLPKLKAPTLIIWGDSDKDAPLRIGKEMHRLIPNSKLEILKNTGHNIYLENPNILYGLINKFINENN